MTLTSLPTATLPRNSITKNFAEFLINMLPLFVLALILIKASGWTQNVKQLEGNEEKLNVTTGDCKLQIQNWTIKRLLSMLRQL